MSLTQCMYLFITTQQYVATAAVFITQTYIDNPDRKCLEQIFYPSFQDFLDEIKFRRI